MNEEVDDLKDQNKLYEKIIRMLLDALHKDYMRIPYQ